MPLATVLSHQGGWDEFLILAGPVAALMGLLWLGSRWAHSRVEAPPDEEDEAVSP